jgi:hypothetical protein
MTNSFGKNARGVDAVPIALQQRLRRASRLP